MAWLDHRVRQFKPPPAPLVVQLARITISTHTQALKAEQGAELLLGETGPAGHGRALAREEKTAGPCFELTAEEPKDDDGRNAGQYDRIPSRLYGRRLPDHHNQQHMCYWTRAGTRQAPTPPPAAAGPGTVRVFLAPDVAARSAQRH
jgi:hypothetical protein